MYLYMYMYLCRDIYISNTDVSTYLRTCLYMYVEVSIYVRI